MSAGTMKRSLFSGTPSTRAVSGCMMNGPMKFDQSVYALVERIPARDHAVGLDGRGAVLGIAEALADDDVRFREGTVGIAVDESPVAGQVGADRLVKDWRARLERALDVDDGGQRLVVDDHGLRRVLGQVAASCHDDRATGSPTKRTLSVAAQ